MAIQNHPLAAKELGEFQHHTVFNAEAGTSNRPDWQTLFVYERGSIVMSVSQNNYKYQTVLTNKQD